MRWVQVAEEPCPWCVIWVGPHEHSVRDDGSLGVLVRRISTEADPR